MKNPGRPTGHMISVANRVKKEEAGEFLLQPKRVSANVKGTYFFFFAVFFAGFFFVAAFFLVAIYSSPPSYPQSL